SGLAVRQLGEAGVFEHLADTGAPQGAGNVLEPEGVVDVSRSGSAQHDRVLKHHGLAPAVARCSRASPADAAPSPPEEPVTEAQEQTLAGAIRPENDGTRTTAQRESDAVDQPFADGLEGEAVELQRQDRSRVHGER